MLPLHNPLWHVAFLTWATHASKIYYSIVFEFVKENFSFFAKSFSPLSLRRLAGRGPVRQSAFSSQNFFLEPLEHGGHLRSAASPLGSRMPLPLPWISSSGWPRRGLPWRRYGSVRHPQTASGLPAERPHIPCRRHSGKGSPASCSRVTRPGDQR